MSYARDIVVNSLGKLAKINYKLFGNHLNSQTPLALSSHKWQLHRYESYVTSFSENLSHLGRIDAIEQMVTIFVTEGQEISGKASQ